MGPSVEVSRVNDPPLSCGLSLLSFVWLACVPGCFQKDEIGALGGSFASGGRSAAVCACLLERLLLRVAPLFYPYYLLPRSFLPGLARAVMGSAGGVMSLRSMLHLSLIHI